MRRGIGTMPRTQLGKWSAGLCIAFVILIQMKLWGLNPMPTFSIAALGLGGFAAGLVAIVKNKDRSALTFLSILVGLLIVLWISAELIYPH